ncbi:unnamed protein product [Linum tenue]|uniref:Methyltransferase PMT26 n=1 Tax=Linum tenue TaxID=586396 RepID=A0AAV0RFD9_9ROSI|nr:unnamed protein product [Linum tenue]
MAQGKYARIDNNRRQQPPSNNYCSTVTIVVFVALCLVGVWMMTSSSIVPGQNVDMPIPKTGKNDVKDQVTDSSINSTAKKVDNNQGGLSEDVKKASEDTRNPHEFDNVDVHKDQKEKKPEETYQHKYDKKPSKMPEPKLDEKPEEKPKEKPIEKTTTSSEAQPENKDVTVRHADGQVNQVGGETKSNDGQANIVGQGDLNENTSEEDKSSLYQNKRKHDLADSIKASNDKTGESEVEKVNESQVVEKGAKKDKNEVSNQSPGEQFPSGAQAELTNETSTENGSWSTQAMESKNEKDTQESDKELVVYNWKSCNSTAGPDFIPCLDNWRAIKNLRSTMHYEHRERHCPEEPPTCLVPLPEGYRRPIKWPNSRKKIWYSNVPHTELVEYKGHQNWVKVAGRYLVFPGGGTQFKHGALHYIDFINENVPDIAWGKHSRVILDVGCGVASFGGFLFDRDVLAMSLAPKDEHEAQVQFALERGIPAISAVMGTLRLPFPGKVFDVVHCARCRVPWHIEGGKLLLELNRLLRPGGYFVWSATPVYQKKPEDKEIWKAMSKLLETMCWELVTRVGLAIYKKPMNNSCYEKRSVQDPPMCEASDDANAAWNVPLQTCMHKVPIDSLQRGSRWPEQWPARLDKTPYWMLGSEMGVYGKPQPEDFVADYEHWKRVVSKSYINGMGINWATVRNVMDMRAIYGGFAAALKDMNVWVMNVVPIDSPDVLPAIYERGLFGIYHDWCQSFSTYPRSYDLMHADHLFSMIKQKCKIVPLVVEVDRILRPEGKLIVRDTAEVVSELESILRSMQWEIRMTYNKDNEGLLSAQKTMWRPKEFETLDYGMMT